METHTINENPQIYERLLPGAYKGRGRAYLPLLACPIDQAALTTHAGQVQCTADPLHLYPFEDGILRLVPPEHRARIDTLSAAHDEQCAARGWNTPDEAGFKSLPQTALPGYPETYWPEQATGTALLWRYLEQIRLESGGLPIGPAGDAAVIGAGMGWLAYGLDVAGYTTLALDARAGVRGLGAYPIARYLCVQADPAQPPLAHEALDLVIFQEGLPGADSSAALEQAVHALRPGGALAVMSVLDPDELAARLDEVGLSLMAPPRREGLQARLVGLTDRLTRRDSVPPPVLVAQKPA